ncbi:MAG: S8 family serine peptidase [Lachnospiraceae bacterium]|nr:S8 family serine peptidase [Lachnospiraceae bacterium]
MDGQRITGNANEKLEDLLNFSLDLPEEERMRAENLRVGYEPGDRTWELIVKYHGDLLAAAKGLAVAELLIAGYAIVTIEENRINEFAKLPEVEYIEMPKRLFFQETDGRRAICLERLSAGDSVLSGKGCLVAVLDSGIDIFLDEFRDAEGNTRIAALWDQTLENGLPPEGFVTGRYFSKEEINRRLSARPDTGFVGGDVVPGLDTSGHGTAVASIAAGSRIGVASGAELVAVKLGIAKTDSFPRTTELMRGLTFAVRFALRENKPLAINLSFGNVYGDHLGGSLLERFLDNIAEIGKTVICVGSGNEAASGGHYVGMVGKEGLRAEFSVGDYEPELNLQLWKSYYNDIRVTLISPGGERITMPENERGAFRYRVEGTLVLAYLGTPLPYNALQEYYFEFLPGESTNTYLPTGIWALEIVLLNENEGAVWLYLPSRAVRSDETGFFLSTPEGTLTIPSGAQRVITVGAYNSETGAYADFSGRGWQTEERMKPDVVAPGVNVIAAVAGGGYQSVTGTSFAAPYATGSAALIMEWGIIRGNDTYLYGQKMKAYFIRGAKKLRGITRYPDYRVGWGALCVDQSLPE